MKILRNIFIGILALGLYSCEKDEGTIIQRGDIVGFVKLIDENGRELTDRSGVKVELENTSYNTLTDTNGRYVLKNAPAGTYHLSYSLDVFGGTTIQGYQFIGGNMPALIYERKLYQQPSYTYSNLDVTYANDGINISMSYLAPSLFRAKIYFHTSSNVSIDNYSFSNSIGGTDGKYDGEVNSITELEWIPITQGETIYYVVYLFNYYEPYYKHTSYKKATEVTELLLN